MSERIDHAAEGASSPMVTLRTTEMPLTKSGSPAGPARTSYIDPRFPKMLRGLYRADLSPKSIQSVLDLAADLVQELIDLKAEIRDAALESATE